MHQLIRQALEQRAAANNPVRIALVGCGRFGTSVAAQISQIPGMLLVAAVDPKIANGQSALEAAGWTRTQWQQVESAKAAASAADTGHAVLGPDVEILDLLNIDVVVEATGHPEVGAASALRAIRLGRHVIMVTVEADVTCGWALANEARSQGVIYSLTAGDQPGTIMELLDWAQTCGLKVVAAGRGTKFYPSDADGNPSEAFGRYGYNAELVERRRLNPNMYNSFRDGTKAQIEMCAVSNMTGLPPDVRGMHQPSASLHDIPMLFTSKAKGGLLENEGVVDLANAVSLDGQKLVPNHIEIGVWVVVTSEQGLIREDLSFYGLPTDPSGERALLYRPFHLCGVETPVTIAQAALLKTTTGTPQNQPTSEVVAVAKRSLSPGDVLDGSGGKNVGGIIERRSIVARDKLLPLGFAYGAAVNQQVRSGEVIPSAAVPRQTGTLVKLREAANPARDSSK